MADVPSTFELQSAIVAAASRSGRPVLNAGRGEPNWLATTPRSAAHLLGSFAVAEAVAACDHRGWGRHVAADGIAARFGTALAGLGGDEGATFLTQALAFGSDDLGFEPDAFVHELVAGSLGASYPSPTRSLMHVEQVLRAYISAAMCQGEPVGEQFQVFATEGGAAAMAYVFRSLKETNLVGPGDRIALATPVFTPYLQIPTLRSFGFEVTELAAEPTARRFGDEVFERLLDPAIKVLFLINPGNPDSRALPPDRLERFHALIAKDRPDLIVVTDTVYATFIDGFRSLVAELPRNIICVHSFSKHFGATGARMGFIAVHQDTIIDELLAAQAPTIRAGHEARYRSMTSDIGQLSFLQRMVADSREVALHNIAGLATPDQIQMALFALTFLVPGQYSYFRDTRAMLRARLHALYEPLMSLPPGGEDSFYYALLDLLEVAEHRHGPAFATLMRERCAPADVVVRLAAEHGVVVLPGASFGACAWDVRVSLASLDEPALRQIGEAIATLPDVLHAELA